jgi:HEAT repeat protein
VDSRAALDLVWLALGFSIAAWLAISVAVLVSRVRYDRRQSSRGPVALNPRTAARLVGRVRRTPRTEWGRWKRIAALQRLERAHHNAVPALVGMVLGDADERVASAALRTLGDVGDEWAVDILLDALRRGRGPRSRVAAELERLAPAPGPKLVPLLRDWDPRVRFWAATLLARYPDLAESSLVALTWDSDPNVRAAAVETLGTRKGEAVESALVARLDDSEWFVRVHAARAAGHVVGSAAAPSIAPLLADSKWWVRTAAKDALRGMGVDGVPALLSLLGHEDAFARNGAAEVLQDVGFVDFLVQDDPTSPLLERIYAAGGDRLREAAEERAEEVSESVVRAA